MNVQTIIENNSFQNCDSDPETEPWRGKEVNALTHLRHGFLPSPPPFSLSLPFPPLPSFLRTWLEHTAQALGQISEMI